MIPENIVKLDSASHAVIRIKPDIDRLAKAVCEVMDAEHITDPNTAMFHLLDRAQMRFRTASRDYFSDTAGSNEDIRRAREYLVIAVKLARSGQ